MENQIIIDKVKKAFCELTSFKERNNSLEIITAYSTMNDKFVSVFVTYTKDKIVITDSGWVDQNYYETPLFEDSEDLLSRIKASYLASYKVKSILDKSGVEYFYKTCKSVEEIPSMVFDLSNFIVGIVNSLCIQFKDEKEHKERETFKKDANDFLKAHYSENVKLRSPLDDFNNIKFNAIISKKSKLYLITYITGSTQNYFENDLRKSIVNFEIASKSKYKDFISEKISILNNNSEGFNPVKSSSIFELLNEKITREPIIWSEREKLLKII